MADMNQPDDDACMLPIQILSHCEEGDSVPPGGIVAVDSFRGGGVHTDTVVLIDLLQGVDCTPPHRQRIVCTSANSAQAQNY